MYNSKIKKLIISGANGYFGSIACQYFEEKGWKVLKATRHGDSDIYFDLDHPKAFSQLEIDTSVDLFIHAAAAHEVYCRQEPYRSIFQNVVGTKSALDFCVKNSIKSFVYLSTFHVFGNPSGIIDENSIPFPMSDYGLSHLQAEEYVQMYTRQGNIQGIVIRPSNFFGVPTQLSKFQRWSLAPFAFCKEAVENKKISLRTPGYQLRNFVSVKDICSVIEKILINQISLLHIPGPNTISIRGLAKLVQRIMQTHFHTDIEIIIPEGISSDEDFNYKSIYLNKIHVPSESMEEFIIGFCKELIE